MPFGDSRIDTETNPQIDYNEPQLDYIPWRAPADLCTIVYLSENNHGTTREKCSQ